MNNDNKTDADIFRSIFEGANDVITFVDRSGKIINVNPKVKEVLGYEPEEIIGKNFARLKLIQLKDVPKLVKLFKNTIRRGKVKPIMELELKRKGGGTVPVEVGTSFIRENGKVRWVVNVYRDISERKKMEGMLRRSHDELEKRVEERTKELKEANRRLKTEIKERRQTERDLRLFQGLIDGSRDFISIIDLESGRYIYVNKTVCQRTGYSREQWRKMRVSDIDPTVTESWDAERERKRRKKEKIYIREGQLKKKDGIVIPLEIVSSIVHSAGKDYLVASARDITQRKQAEEDVGEAKTDRKISDDWS